MIRRLIARMSARWRRIRYRRPLTPGPSTGPRADLLYRAVPLAFTRRRNACGMPAHRLLPRTRRATNGTD